MSEVPLYKDFVCSKFEGHVTTLAPHQALKLIVGGKLTFDEMVVVHPVDSVRRDSVVSRHSPPHTCLSHSRGGGGWCKL